MRREFGQAQVGFLLTGLDGGGAERNMLRLAAAFIARGHQADLMIPRLAGDYRAAVPSGMRVYRARIPGTDRELLRAVQRSGADVKVMTVNPFRVVWNWLALGRKASTYPFEGVTASMRMQLWSRGTFARRGLMCWCRRCRVPTPPRSAPPS